MDLAPRNALEAARPRVTLPPLVNFGMHGGTGVAAGKGEERAPARKIATPRHSHNNNNGIDDRALRFLQEQHRDVLQNLYREIEALKGENKGAYVCESRINLLIPSEEGKRNVVEFK